MRTCLMLVLGLWSFGLWGQSGKEASLDTVRIVSGTEAVAQTPVTFTNLQRSEIERRNFGQEPSFILSHTPSVTVYSDAGSYQGYSYFRLRGIDQTRINMTLDGVPLNEPEDQGVYFSNYPDFFNSVSGLQIQRGVGTSQNGTVSYGGALLFQSPRLARPKSTRIGLNYGSFNSYRLFAEHQTGPKERLSAYVRASLIHSDGFKERSAHDSQSLFFSLGWNGKPDSYWKVTGFAGRQENQMAWLGAPEDSIAANPRYNANGAEDDAFFQSLIYLNNTRRLSFDTELRSCVYFNFLDGNYDFDLNNFLELPSTTEMYNYAFRSRFVGGYTNLSFPWRNAKMTAGFHANTYARTHTGSERSFGELYQNTGYRQMASIFLRRERELRKWTLFGDLQLRYSRFAYAGSVDMPVLDWLNLNPTFGLTHRLNSQLSLYLSAGRATREPTRNDIFGGNDDLLADSTGNALLFITDQEQVVDLEAGVRWKKDRFAVQANLFYMRFQNEIQLSGQFGPNGLALTRSAAQSVRAGLELDVQYDFPFGLTLLNRSSLGRYRIEESGTEFEPVLSPPWIVNQEFIYTHNRISVGLGLRGQGPSWLDFANTEQLDSYWLLDGWIGYQRKSWELRLRGQNLTDQTYFNNGYLGWDGAPRLFVQAPRNANLAFTWTF